MTTEVELSQGKTAIVSDQDYDRVSRYTWHTFRIHRTWYVATNGINGKRTYLHRFIMQANPGAEVDHINGNGLDNRRCNLRLCTHAQNLANQRHQQRKTSSPHKGVTWCKKGRVWLAQIKANQKHYNLGSYDSEEDAARAYNRAANEYFGEYARLNDVPNPLGEPTTRRTLAAYRARQRAKD